MMKGSIPPFFPMNCFPVKNKNPRLWSRDMSQFFHFDLGNFNGFAFHVIFILRIMSLGLVRLVCFKVEQKIQHVEIVLGFVWFWGDVFFFHPFHQGKAPWQTHHLGEGCFSSFFQLQNKQIEANDTEHVLEKGIVLKGWPYNSLNIQVL